MKRLAAFLACVVAAAPVFGLVIPEGWDFGSSDGERVMKTSFAVTNNEESSLSIDFIFPCDCLSMTPDSLTLEPGQIATVWVSFNPAGYSGKVEKTVLVRIRGDGDRTFMVSGSVTPVKPPVPDYPGECEWCRKQPEEVRRQAYEAWRSGPGVIHFYYAADCRSCVEFLDKEIPRLSVVLGAAIEVDKLDIKVRGVLAELEARLADKKARLTAFPVLFIGETILQGEDQIRKNLEGELKKRAKKTGG
jgi:hypothetical protein